MSVIEQFENEFRRFTGSKYAIACCNGTAALHTAVTAVGISKGDKVITTPFSFIASANCILYNQAIPIFADIDPQTLCISPREVKKHLEQNRNTKAIICVHLFGKVCNLTALKMLAKKAGVPLIEDCSQALGATYQNIHVGNFGAFGTFSFYMTKNLTTFEGGMLITNNSALAEKARLIINHGQTERHTHTILGYNYRITPISALIGLTMLKLHRKAILAELGSYGLKNGYYPFVIYNQPLYKKLGITGNCPIAEKIALTVRMHGKS